MRFNSLACVVLLVVLTSVSVSAGQEAPAESKPVLKVGVMRAAPFTIKEEDGTWSGVAVDLWRAVARQLGRKYELHEAPLDKLLHDLETGELDVAIGAITVTSAREKHIDYSHAFEVSELVLALPTERTSPWQIVANILYRRALAQLILGLLILAAVTGTLVWLCERKNNPEQFSDSPLRGIGNGIWWSLVTMTTVGYGDKSPRTFVGRVIAILWMFIGIALLTFFTAAVTSAITVDRLRARIYSSEDLTAGLRIGTIEGSTSEEYLASRELPARLYDLVPAALADLERDRLDVVVYDAPVLRYWAAKKSMTNLTMVPVRFKKQFYALAFKPGSQLREPVNQIIPDLISTPRWLAIKERYFGFKRDSDDD